MQGWVVFGAGRRGRRVEYLGDPRGAVIDTSAGDGSRYAEERDPLRVGQVSTLDHAALAVGMRAIEIGVGGACKVLVLRMSRAGVTAGTAGVVGTAEVVEPVDG